MRLSNFINALDKLEVLKFQLPNGEFVPAHFHITEVGNINLNYIDCGGILRQEKKISLQLWVASDTEHRLKPENLLNILQLAEKQLGFSNIEIEVEYQQSTIGRYELSIEGDVFQLINTQTACLAPDQCGIPKEKARVRVTANGLNCNPETGCC